MSAQLANLGAWIALVLASVAHAQPLPGTPSSTETAENKKPKLEKKEIGNMRPVHALGDIYLAGQPSQEDLKLLKKNGIQTIISVRKSDELPWDEAAAVKQQGMKFVGVPFGSANELKPQVFDEVLKVLRDEKSGPTVFHCGSANRVGAIWYAHRVLDGKLSPSEALHEAKVVGLRTPEYLERAQAYVEHAKKRAAATKPGKQP